MQVAKCRPERCCKDYCSDSSTSCIGTLSAGYLNGGKRSSPSPLARPHKHCLCVQVQEVEDRPGSFSLCTSLQTQSSTGSCPFTRLADGGSIHDREQVSARLAHKQEISWHSLVSDYVNCGKPEHALWLFSRMQDDNCLHSSGRTFIALLKACLMLQDVVKSLEIHAEVARLGLLSRDAFVSSTLVDLYSKFGLLSKAEEVFYDLATGDVVSWNTLITGYVKHGLGQQALNLFQRMELQGVGPNSVTFICILKACGLDGAAEKGSEIHAEVVRTGLLERDPVVGSTLVDMYAKCGSLEKAQEVFDSLSTRNVITWTALIAGYTERQCGREAINAYGKMQLDRIVPNVVTFICLSKACGIIGAKEKGQEIHCEISRRGILQTDLTVGNALVDMYAKCDSLASAHEVFDNLVHVDIISWNTLIAGYSEQGHHMEALQCLKQMQLEDVQPDIVTIICSLKSCGGLGQTEEGQELHAYVEKKGLLEKQPVGNALVDMYAKCGLHVKARQVFNELSGQDTISWNVLMAGYAECDCDEKTLELMEQMQHVGLSPDAVSFICSLKACPTKGKVEELYIQVEKLGLLDGNPMLGNTLVDIYAKHGCLDTSYYVFSRLSVRYVVAWNALISGYSEHGYGEVALECFGGMELEGVSPDDVTFLCCLKVCGSLGAIDEGQALHAELTRQGLVEQDLTICNSLVDMYAKCCQLATAEEVFNGILGRDVVSWNVLITGYLEEGHAAGALELLKQMRAEGVTANDVTFVCGLKACSGLGALEEGQKIHDEIEKTGMSDGKLVSSSLVDTYAKCGSLAEARHLFNKLACQDVCLWNVIISGYAEQEQSATVLDCLEQMRAKAVVPDTLTFFYCLKACGSAGAISNGAWIHAEVIKTGSLEDNVVLGGALIDMYVKCALLASAQNVFDNLLHRDVGSWNGLMAGYDDLGECDAVFHLFHRMVGDYLKPDSVTFITLLNACSQRGLIQKAIAYFESMSRDYGIAPTSEHQTCVLDLLSRVGQVDKAMVIMNKLPCSDPDAVMWRTLLGACSKWGNLKLGTQSFEHAVCLNERDAAAYVLISNIYTDTAMQQEVTQKSC